MKKKSSWLPSSLERNQVAVAIIIKKGHSSPVKAYLTKASQLPSSYKGMCPKIAKQPTNKRWIFSEHKMKI